MTTETIDELRAQLAAVTEEWDQALKQSENWRQSWNHDTGELRLELSTLRTQLAAEQEYLSSLVELGRQDGIRWCRETHSNSNEAIIAEWRASLPVVAMPPSEREQLHALQQAAHVALRRFYAQNGQVSEQVWNDNYAACKGLHEALGLASLPATEPPPTPYTALYGAVPDLGGGTDEEFTRAVAQIETPETCHRAAVPGRGHMWQVSRAPWHDGQYFCGWCGKRKDSGTGVEITPMVGDGEGQSNGTI